MTENELIQSSARICEWLDAHPGYSFNSLCKKIKLDSANGQRYRKLKVFPERCVLALEEELEKVQAFVPWRKLQDGGKVTTKSIVEAIGDLVESDRLASESMTKLSEKNDYGHSGGGSGYTNQEVKVIAEETGVDLHPDQDRFPGRLLGEGTIDYKLRMVDR